jgi:hypothetical protein
VRKKGQVNPIFNRDQVQAPEETAYAYEKAAKYPHILLALDAESSATWHLHETFASLVRMSLKRPPKLVLIG